MSQDQLWFRRRKEVLHQRWDEAAIRFKTLISENALESIEVKQSSDDSHDLHHHPTLPLLSCDTGSSSSAPTTSPSKNSELLHKELQTLLDLNDQLYIFEFENLPDASHDKMTRTEIEGIIRQLEEHYAQRFCSNNLELAQAKLRTFSLNNKAGPPPAIGNTTTNWFTFYLGLRLGIVVILCCWTLWDCIIDESRSINLWQSPVIIVYRGTGVLILLQYLWGLQIYIWQYFDIDYRECFELPNRQSYITIWERASTASIVYLTNLILYYKALRGYIGHVPSYVYPLLLFLYLSWIVFRSFGQYGGFWRSFVRVVLSPFSRVYFREVYLGDVLTSLIRVSVDVAWMVCYFVTGEFTAAEAMATTYGHDSCTKSRAFQNVVVPFLHCLPLWWRFCQNMKRYHDTHRRFPHLPNAFKYAFAQLVVAFGVFHPSLKIVTLHSTYQALWLIAFVLTTLYQFTWDVLMDWGLGKSREGGLRQTRLFPSRMIYYVAIVLDFVLRFFWTMTLIPESVSSPFGIFNLQVYLSPVLAAAEVFRRSVWGCIRVENEYLTKTQRVYNQDSLSPLQRGGRTDATEGSQRRFGFRIIAELSVIVLAVLFITGLAAFSKPSSL